MGKHKYIPGLSARKAKVQINEENKAVSKDTNNREYVVKTGIKYLKEGLSEEKVLDKLMEDKIVTEFEYLSKSGLDIRKCFKEWINRKLEHNNKKIYDNDDRSLD